jgi:mannose-P-dolichol utilization defect 1
MLNVRGVCRSRGPCTCLSKEYMMGLEEWIWGDVSASCTSNMLAPLLGGLIWKAATTAGSDELPVDGAECWNKLLAKVLGLAIITGACLNKIPVIRNLLRAQSSAGFARSAVLVDLVMVVNSSLYGYMHGYPWTAYGENIALSVQCLIVAILTYRLSDNPIPSVEKVLAVVGLFAYVSLTLCYLPVRHRQVLITSSIPMTIYASGSMILEASKLKHTGSQSFITISMNLIGSVIRILTTIQEVGWDYALLSGYTVGAVLCLAQLVQIVAYRRNTERFIEGRATRRKKE